MFIRNFGLHASSSTEQLSTLKSTDPSLSSTKRFARSCHSLDFIHESETSTSRCSNARRFVEREQVEPLVDDYYTLVTTAAQKHVVAKAKRSQTSSLKMASGKNTGGEQAAMKRKSAVPVDYTVSVVVWEARQLAGLELDPYVEVQVGQQKRKTKTKKNTSDPIFEETFEFEFALPPAVFLEQIVTITATTAGRIFSRRRTIGTFKIDLATVHDQPKHYFFHRWAMLVDESKPLSGAKGFVCCDIIVAKRGESAKLPTADIDPDIEANLLLPDDMLDAYDERMPARYSVSIHSAQWLPNLGSVAFTTMKKYWSGSSPQDLIDPFVQVSFAGQTGKTRVRNNQSNPEWNEQIIFTELFPPLTRTMRIHVRDDGGTVVATAFLDMNLISDNTVQGYMPTFGPSYINLYGAFRGDLDVTPLNFGLGEGVCYRGRILLSLRVQLEEHVGKKGLKQVKTKTTLPLPENICGNPVEHFLFCSILEADMIDKKFLDEDLAFELSMGPYGSGQAFGGEGVLDETAVAETKKQLSKKVRKSTSRETLISMEEIPGHGNSPSPPKSRHIDKRLPEGFPTEGIRWCSRTEAMRPTSQDDNYCAIEFHSKKPCLFIYSKWEDQRLRFFEKNLLKRARNSLALAVTDSQRFVEMDNKVEAEKRLRRGLDVLCANCSEFEAHATAAMDMFEMRSTPLDNHKREQRARDLSAISVAAIKIRNTLTKENVAMRLAEAGHFGDKLEMLTHELQESVPDIFLWLICGQKRLAYRRFRPEDLIYSFDEHERGEHCGRCSTFFLKIPGLSEDADESYDSWCQLTAYFWFGLTDTSNVYLSGLPPGFWPNKVPAAPLTDHYNAPTYITYKDAGMYELRCHIFQGRALLPLDESGLSDPFVRIMFAGQSVNTLAVEQTVNPQWDQTLILPGVRLYGLPEYIEKCPPELIVQVYDADEDGSNEFMGFLKCQPIVKLSKRPYEPPRFPPRLHWESIQKGMYRVGEILACFELIQLDAHMRDYPPLPETITTDGKSKLNAPNLQIMHVPRGIRPVLGKFRVEVMFWGLRRLKPPGLSNKIDRPFVEIEICGHAIKSAPIQNYPQNGTFDQMIMADTVMLPTDAALRPPLTIRCFDGKAFGRRVLIGSHVVSSIETFLKNDNYDNIILELESEEESSPLLANGDVPVIKVSAEDDVSSMRSRGTRLTMEEPLPIDESGRFVINMNELNANQFDEIQLDQTDQACPRLPFTPLDGERATSLSQSGRTMVGDDQSYRSRGERSTRGNRPKSTDQLGIDNAVFEHDDEKQEADRRSLMSTLSRLTSKGESASHNDDVKSTRSARTANKSQRDAQASPVADTPTATPTMELPIDALKESKQKSASKESDIVLDWWSKYYTSLADKNAEARKAREKFKRERKKRGVQDGKKALKKFAFKMFDTAVIASEKLESKMTSKDTKKKADIIPAKRSGVSVDVDTALIPRLKVYDQELEYHTEFNNFADVMRSFRLLRGKAEIEDELDEEKRMVGMFKGNVAISPIRQDDDIDDDPATYFPDLPSTKSVQVLVRVYIVKAINLKGADNDGLADPYLVIKLGNQKQNDKQNRINRSLNPLFGRMFEFETLLPGGDTQLCVQIWDYDRTTADDLMGETRLDLEQRYYSRHRAACGLPKKYDKRGYNAWPDQRRPALILSDLCRTTGIKQPQYNNDGTNVTVNGKTFERTDKNQSSMSPVDQLALDVLHRWQDVPHVGYYLVPEHVEQRSLYMSEQPGVEQGSLHMFVHMFPMENINIPPPIDITPRKPKVYELRVIVWNTKEIPLDDVSPITGCASVDQYIKAFVISPQVDLQQTDVHYRSMSGEGNFNWRMVWRLNYLDAEEKISHKTKAYWYSLVEYEDKVLPRLTMEVWDADSLTSDDCLGTLLLDLNKLPRGSKHHRGCDLNVIDPEKNPNTINLFRQKRCRGWYPFAMVDKSGELMQAGKIDIELNIMTEEEAEARPAGKGHDPPDPTPEPIRPETSFAWFASPLKFLKFGIWDGMKYKFLVLLIVLAVVLFVAMFIYTFPEAVAQRIVQVGSG